MINDTSAVRRLVVGASGSPGSLRALRYARDLGSRVGIPVVAVMAWVPPGGELADARCPSAGLRRAWANAARQRLDEALDAAWGGRPADLDLTRVVIRGEPGPALVDVADRGDDLLVLGAGRRGGLLRMWRGKVGRYCVSRARCPVLAVPPPAVAREMGLRPARWALRHRELTLDRALREWDTARTGPRSGTRRPE